RQRRNHPAGPRRVAVGLRREDQRQPGRAGPGAVQPGRDGHRHRLRDRRWPRRPPRVDSETSNYTYSGTGGVPVSSWIDRSMFALKFAERNFLFSNVIG
ncbi:UPF0182 family protein, partial [Mycolicibacterium insubricum]|nr:UPF0182 family protein [Mycolicibacterium insubricum]